MKRIRALFGLSALLPLLGCVTADQIVLDSTPRTPTSSVDVFKDGKAPQQIYKAIAELSFLGPREEEIRAEKRFIGQAKKMGGNGVLFRVEPAGQKGGGLAFSTAWLFKGTIVVYQ